MNDRRDVRVTDRLPQDLDALLHTERTISDTPSATDCLLYQIPQLIERVAPVSLVGVAIRVERATSETVSAHGSGRRVGATRYGSIFE